MKNINLSVDGGGTSLRLIAFDDDLKIAAQSKSGSVNPNFESNEKIGSNMAEAIKLLLMDLNGGFIIKNVYATIVGSVDFFRGILTHEAGALVKDTAFHHISEAHSHIFAASLGNKGGIALAGTGSGAIYCDNEEIVHVGGYGIPAGDEGSGAWIGIQGMSAAIRYKAGWGEPTILLEKLYDYLNIDSSGYIAGVLYRKDINQRNLYAGFCRYVAECERAGDKAARDIIYSAGRYMSLQMISAVKKAESKNIINAGENPVIYSSGGAWKGTPYMFEAMREIICGVYPGAVCRHGIFDPVMGGVVKFIFDKTGQYSVSDEHKKILREEFKDYLIKQERRGYL